MLPAVELPPLLPENARSGVGTAWGLLLLLLRSAARAGIAPRERALQHNRVKWGLARLCNAVFIAFLGKRSDRLKNRSADQGSVSLLIVYACTSSGSPTDAAAKPLLKRSRWHCAVTKSHSPSNSRSRPSIQPTLAVTDAQVYVWVSSNPHWWWEACFCLVPCWSTV